MPASKDSPSLEFERKPTTPRPKTRNPVTVVDVMLGGAMRQMRTIAGLSLRDVAERMTIPPDNEPHYLVAVPLARIAAEGDNRDLDAALRKAPQRLEAHVQAITASGLVAYARGLSVEPSTILEAAGLSRPRVSLEAAMLGDPRLDDAGKSVLLDMLQSLIAARRR